MLQAYQAATASNASMISQTISFLKRRLRVLGDLFIAVISFQLNWNAPILKP